MSTTVRRPSDAARPAPRTGGLVPKLVISWAFVGIPLAYGVYETAKKASALFTG